jgi:hypothetical protein
MGVPLPDQPEPWWELFDAEWTDLWSVAGQIMRLYRIREESDRARVLGLLTKQDVRKWLEDHAK